VTIGPELIQDMEEWVIQIRKRLKEVEDRQKSYADAHRTDGSYKVGDQVFLSGLIILPISSRRGQSCHLDL
jgi:hypothetical protein